MEIFLNLYLKNGWHVIVGTENKLLLNVKFKITRMFIWKL